MANEYLKDIGNRIFNAAIGIGCLAYAFGGEEENKSNNVTYFRLTPYEKHLERMNYRETLEDNKGLIGEIKQFYYNDLGDAISLSGLVHDTAGIAGGFVLGLSRASNKVLGLFTSYTFAMAPEMYNIYQGNITGKDIFIEGGKDAALVLGAFAVGKLLNYIRDKRFRDYNSLENTVNTGRPWWND